MQRSNWFCEAYLRRAAVARDRLKSTAVGSRDGDDNPRSHADSLNCCGQFWELSE
jgi:hypothetical protein